MIKLIAAMDNSGGSTPSTLDRYGLKNTVLLNYTKDNMMDLIHDMRIRMINTPAFNGDNIGAAILFKDSVDRGIIPSLHKKKVKTFLKIDSGCEENGMLKKINLDEMINYAINNKCYGTKMRSIVYNIDMIDSVLEQQFSLAKKISKKGLIPIIEPEVPIDLHNKEDVELALNDSLHNYKLDNNTKIIFKLTPPEIPNLYYDLSLQPYVLETFFLSGGYSLSEACYRLSLNKNIGASFSRALTEGLKYDQTDHQFKDKFYKNIIAIRDASLQKKIF